MTRYPWLKLRKKTEPELPEEPPIWLGNWSNGEYFRAATPRDRKLRRHILQKADDNARRVGLDRRQFLASTMGMCTTLLAINEISGCASNSAAGGTADRLGNGSGGSSGGQGDAGPSPDQNAGLCVPPEAQYDPEIACATIGGDEFIFDVQTHWFKEDDLSRFPLYMEFMGAIIRANDEQKYVRQIFLESDTTVAVLTSWPGVSCTPDLPADAQCGLPLDNPSMAKSRDHINQLACNTRRVIQHVQLMVQDAAGVEPQLAIMEQMCSEHGVGGWKMYPGAFGGYKMTDPDARAVIERGLELGTSVFAVHKGLPIGTFFNPENNYPDDIGPVAADYPGARFVVYHSGICSGVDSVAAAPPEGPFDPYAMHPLGINALIKSLVDSGIGPNGNVYAEIGSAMDKVMTSPDQAAHFFGKLMKYVGVDRVVWGTDCVIYGSPQPFIEWFRTLEIPESMQEQYGYPPLSAENKAKIFGLNAARLYGIDPTATRCAVESCATARVKRRMDQELGPRRWMFEPPAGPRTWEEFVAHGKACFELGRPS